MFINLLPALGQLDQRMALRPRSFSSSQEERVREIGSKNLNPSRENPSSSTANGIQKNEDLLKNLGNAPLEKFVKQTICTPLKKGSIYTFPGSDNNQTCQGYIVHQKLAGEGLVAYALKPINPDDPPLLVFRCTEPDFSKEQGFPSVLNDLDLRIGERGWNGNKENFNKLMNDTAFRAKGQKIKVAGYSLGGLHANIFAGHYHKDVDHVISYSAPSMTKDLALKFAKDINRAERTDKIKIQIFRTRGDPYIHCGETQFGVGIDPAKANVELIEADVPEPSILIKLGLCFENHGMLIFDEQNNFNFKVTTKHPELNIKLNNSSHHELFRKFLSFNFSSILSNVLNLGKYFSYLSSIRSIKNQPLLEFR